MSAPTSQGAPECHRTPVRAAYANVVPPSGTDDLTDGATIDAFWVNPNLDGATAGEILAANRPVRPIEGDV